MIRRDTPQTSGRMRLWGALWVALAMAGCSPTVKVEAPDKPIEINLNIKIEQEVRVRVERDLEKVFQEDPALFGLEGQANGGKRAP